MLADKTIGQAENGYYVDAKPCGKECPRKVPAFDGGVSEFYEKCRAKLQIRNNSEYGFQFFRKNEGCKKSETSTRVFGLETCRLNAFRDQVKPQYFSFPIKDAEF